MSNANLGFSNAAQLEQKIESLVTLLSAAQGSVAVGRTDLHLESSQSNVLRDFSWQGDSSTRNDGSPGGLNGNTSGKTTDAPSPAESTSGMFVVKLLRER